MNTSLGELLNLRYEFNEITKGFNIPSERKESVIYNLVWFKNNGHSKNRFKPGYDRAVEICNIILKEMRLND